jgi:adenylate cyclase
LPFRSAQADEYFADGIAEEVITALSRYRGLAVIARNSSFTFKGQNATPRQVGSALGVRYLLGGAIRKANGRLRISVELIDTGTGNTLWTDRFEGANESVFELQDEVSERVAAWIGPKVELAEVEKAKRKPLAVVSAYDAYLRGLPHSYTVSREGSDKALALFHEAIRLDPEFAPAHAAAAVSYGHRFLNGWMHDVSGESGEAIRLARRAVYLDPEDGRTLERAGAVLLLIAEDAIAAAALIERALTINPNSAGAWLQRAWIEIFTGDLEDGLAAADRCIRLNPLDPVRSTFYGAKALAYFFLDRYEEAYDWSKRSVAEKPFTAFFRCLAASAAMSGRLQEASEAVSEVLRRDPAARISSLKQYQRRPELLAKWNKGLRTAGLPE